MKYTRYRLSQNYATHRRCCRDVSNRSEVCAWQVRHQRAGKWPVKMWRHALVLTTWLEIEKKRKKKRKIKHKPRLARFSSDIEAHWFSTQFDAKYILHFLHRNIEIFSRIATISNVVCIDWANQSIRRYTSLDLDRETNIERDEKRV